MIVVIESWIDCGEVDDNVTGKDEEEKWERVIMIMMTMSRL